MGKEDEEEETNYSTLSAFVFDYFLFAVEIKQAVDILKMQQKRLSSVKCL